MQDRLIVFCTSPNLRIPPSPTHYRNHRNFPTNTQICNPIRTTLNSANLQVPVTIPEPCFQLTTECSTDFKNAPEVASYTRPFVTPIPGKSTGCSHVAHSAWRESLYQHHAWHQANASSRSASSLCFHSHQPPHSEPTIVNRPHAPLRAIGTAATSPRLYENICNPYEKSRCILSYARCSGSVLLCRLRLLFCLSYCFIVRTSKAGCAPTSKAKRSQVEGKAAQSRSNRVRQQS